MARDANLLSACTVAHLLRAPATGPATPDVSSPQLTGLALRRHLAGFTRSGGDWVSYGLGYCAGYPGGTPAQARDHEACRALAQASAGPDYAGGIMQQLSTADPQTLVTAGRRELVKLFGSARAGAIPDGRGRGTALLGTGGPAARLAAGLVYALAWRGKMVNARTGRLKNIVTPLGIQAIEAAVYQQDSWYDGQPCIVLDYSKTSLVARYVRDEIREIAPGVYLGLVFVWRYHVLDFALDFTR